MPTPRAAVLAAVFSVMMVFAVAPAQAAQRDDPIEKLSKQADEAKADLQKATKQMEDRRRALTESQKKLRETLRDLAGAEAELDRIRAPLAQLANASYQRPGAVGNMSVFGSGDPTVALRATADVQFVAGQQNRLVERAGEVTSRRERLASTAQELQARGAVEQTKVQQEISGLKTKSANIAKELTATLDRLNVGRARRLELKCDPDLAGDARRFPNGLIPDRYLCELPQKGKQLRADAALGFFKLNAAYKRRFGSDMCVTDSYRNIADQHRVYAQRPGFAAVPGTSNHGKGQALDLCGGIQNGGSVQFRWMEANAGQYGWFHPAWAYSNPYEPWHWEFGRED